VRLVGFYYKNDDLGFRPRAWSAYFRISVEIYEKICRRTASRKDELI